MDPLTHKVVDKRPSVILAGLGPDIPFYLTYPAWVIAQGKVKEALTTNEWPDPPRWMETLHHAFHSLPMTLIGAALIWILKGSGPGQELMDWILHIVMEISTHSRRPWGPQFLWPLSDFAVEGDSWVELAWRNLKCVAIR